MNQTQPRTVLLVSPPFSCGVAYIGNILLSLGLKVQPPNQPEDGGYWTRMPDGSHQITGASLDHYRTHFHILETCRTFRFDPAWTVIMEHEIGMTDDVHDAVILFVRDPIDSLYSWHRRYIGNDTLFRDYLDRILMPANHMPIVMAATPLLTYSVFVSYWLSGKRKPMIIVRYEDIKQRPLEVVREVLDFLGIERGEARISESVAASDVAGLLQSQQASSGAKIARRGAAYEWREHMSREDWEGYTAVEPIRSVCAMLGYRAAHDGAGDILTPPDPAFSSYLHALLNHMEGAIRAGGGRGGVTEAEALVPAAAAEAMRMVDFAVANAVMACGGLAVDRRLIAGYRAAASAMILLLNGCGYFSPERNGERIAYSNANFHERFVGLASLLYRTQNEADVAQMVTGLLLNVRTMSRHYEWGKVMTVPVGVGEPWADADALLRLVPRSF